MIETLLSYLKREVLPRWKTIIFTSEFALSLLVACLVGWLGPGSFHSKPLMNEFVAAVAAYAAIAMGFCVAGMTIALTLPSKELMERLATKTIPGVHGNSLSGLLFVFSWTAFVHWFAVLLMFTALLVYGSDQPLLGPDASAAWRVGASITCAFVFYCLCQFAITIITISQAGEVYIDELKKEVARKEEQKQN
jgi:hypothetical protein